MKLAKIIRNIEVISLIAVFMLWVISNLLHIAGVIKLEYPIIAVILTSIIIAVKIWKVKQIEKIPEFLFVLEMGIAGCLTIACFFKMIGYYLLSQSGLTVIILLILMIIKYAKAALFYHLSEKMKINN